MGNLLIVVPARGGSKGVPDKNILDLNGKPLFVHSLDYARRSRLRDSEVLLSTDSAEYADIAESFGYKVPFLRTPSAARDESTDLEFMLDAREKYTTLLNQSFQYFAILRPTSPMRPAGLIEKSLKILEGEPQIDDHLNDFTTTSRLALGEPNAVNVRGRGISLQYEVVRMREPL